MYNNPVGGVMKAIIEIEMDDTAFEDDLVGELSEILARCRHNIVARMAEIKERGYSTIVRTLLDANGNTVGKVTVIDPHVSAEEPIDKGNKYYVIKEIGRNNEPEVVRITDDREEAVDIAKTAVDGGETNSPWVITVLVNRVKRELKVEDYTKRGA